MKAVEVKIDNRIKLRVKTKKLNENAVLPYKTHDRDFCYDCVAVSEEEVSPNIWKYGLGLAFEVDREGYDFNLEDHDISIDARPRSSVWKTGMVLSNCEGTVDELYRGEVMAVFYHVMPNMPRYKIGDRICQIKLGVTVPLAFEFIDELSDTVRGEGGYGSTGR